MKADCAIKRMCKDEKNHECVGQKIHREARAEVLGRRKISPLFPKRCSHCLFTFRQTNYVIILISKKQVLTVRASKSLTSSLQSERKGKEQAQYKDALTSDSACGITFPEWLSSTNIFQHKGTAEDPSLLFRFYDKVLRFGMPSSAVFFWRWWW